MPVTPPFVSVGHLVFLRACASEAKWVNLGRGKIWATPEFNEDGADDSWRQQIMTLLFVRVLGGVDVRQFLEFGDRR